MNEIFEKCMELGSLITKVSSGSDIISIDVNTAMCQLKQSKALMENERVKEKFFAERYFELVDDLVKYGIVKKEWED